MTCCRQPIAAIDGAILVIVIGQDIETFLSTGLQYKIDSAVKVDVVSALCRRHFLRAFREGKPLRRRDASAERREQQRRG